MKILRNRKGQGTLEYILIAAAVIAIAFAVMNKIKPAADTKALQISTDLNK